MLFFFKAFIVASALLAYGCGHGSHSIKCVIVSGQSVCFIREVWGLNGDRVVLTTSTNVCHQPSAETDYVSDALGAGHSVYYKIEDGKLHVYGSIGQMIKPRKVFPVEVEFPNLMNPEEANCVKTDTHAFRSKR